MEHHRAILKDLQEKLEPHFNYITGMNDEIVVFSKQLIGGSHIRISGVTLYIRNRDIVKRHFPTKEKFGEHEVSLADPNYVNQVMKILKNVEKLRELNERT